jgi:predicted Zn finger-like uncharacterized protein
MCAGAAWGFLDMKAEIGDLGWRFYGTSDSSVMILTCPECATSYFVDDAKVPAAGRLVKCTSCGARWTATKDAAPAVEAPPKPAPEAVPTPFVPAIEDDLVVSPIQAPTFAASRAPRSAPKQEAAGKVVVWAVAAVVVVGLIASAILFRSQVVRILPASQTAYAGIGLPVNALGLVIEKVSAKPVFQGGRPVLAVTGIIRSVHDKPASAPALRISLLDRAGKPVAVKVATPLDAGVPARATRHFAIAIIDPPASVHDLEVAFDAPHKDAPQGPAAVHAPIAEHAADPAAAPAPVEAQPLPPGSKDALPHHD